VLRAGWSAERVFATLAGVDRRLAQSDIVTMRRALAMSPTLAPDQTRWLLDEAERLLTARARLEQAMAELAPPWGEVRAVLNDLHALLHDDGSAPPGRRPRR
jgi:hypothetical protein